MSINPKFQPILITLGMALLMGLAMSTTMTLAKVGYGPGFWAAWWGAFWLSNLVGIPFSLACAPLVARLATWLTSARSVPPAPADRNQPPLNRKRQQPLA